MARRRLAAVAAFAGLFAGALGTVAATGTITAAAAPSKFHQFGGACAERLVDVSNGSLTKAYAFETFCEKK